MRKRYSLKKRLPNLMFIHALPPNMRFGIEEDMFKERNVHGGVKFFVGWRIAKTLFELENTLGKCTYWLEEQICYDFEDTHERMPCNQIL